jgi:benzodiazapine receptor
MAEINEAGRAGRLSRPAALAIVVAALGISAVVGRRNAPDPSHPQIRRWYKRLSKPSYTPPDAAFGAVWPVLETGLGVGAYRLLRQPASDARTAAVALWLVNVALIGGWTQLFFKEKALGPSAITSAAMIATGAGYGVASAKVDKVAAMSAVPFVAWLGFATLLAEQIWVRNDASAPST